MKKTLLILFSLISINIFAQDIDKENISCNFRNNSWTDTDDSRKVFNGYDGGMMLHLGYVETNVAPLNYKAEGMTKGIGGAIRFHFGKHYRIGTEGYVSTLKLMYNGSYMKTFWAGLVNDFYWNLGKFMPYAGLTIGGGALTDCFIFGGNNHDWEKESDVVINKTPFFAIDPIIGCDYCISDAIHITVKFDCLFGFGNENLYLPIGPRAYIGFIFFH